jgi:hypothetical protein
MAQFLEFPPLEPPLVERHRDRRRHFDTGDCRLGLRNYLLAWPLAVGLDNEFGWGQSRFEWTRCGHPSCSRWGPLGDRQHNPRECVGLQEDSQTGRLDPRISPARRWPSATERAGFDPGRVVGGRPTHPAALHDVLTNSVLQGGRPPDRPRFQVFASWLVQRQKVEPWPLHFLCNSCKIPDNCVVKSRRNTQWLGV